MKLPASAESLSPLREYHPTQQFASGSQAPNYPREQRSSAAQPMARPASHGALLPPRRRAARNKASSILDYQGGLTLNISHSLQTIPFRKKTIEAAAACSKAPGKRPLDRILPLSHCFWRFVAKARAHFPNLCRLLLKLARHSLQFSLQLRDHRFLLLRLFVRFEKLVEQHRVDRFVTHAVRLAFLVADDQVGIDLLHFLGNQLKLRHSVRIALVVERHRPQRQNRFTAFAHVGNVLLKPSRGRDRAELPVLRDNDRRRRGVDGGHAITVGNPGGVADVGRENTSSDRCHVVRCDDADASV